MKYHDKGELHFCIYISSRHCNRVCLSDGYTSRPLIVTSIDGVYILPFFPLTLYLTDNTRDGQNKQLITVFFFSKRRGWHLISEAKRRKEEEKNGLL